MASDILDLLVLIPGRLLPVDFQFLAMQGGSQAAIGIVRDRASIGY